jgi:protein CpxP
VKRPVSGFARLRRRIVEAGALVAISALTSLTASTGAHAAQTPTPPAATASPPAATASPPAVNSKSESDGGFDALVKHLHGEFKITSAQEALWQKVVDVMRENAETLNKLAKSRSGNAHTMTAVDDLKSYSEISEAHAQGTKRLIPVFQALYDSMTDDQKKAADTEFQEHYRGHHQHHGVVH